MPKLVNIKNMKKENGKKSLWLIPLLGIVCMISVYLLSCNLNNADAALLPEADDFPLLTSEEIPIDTVLFRYATFLRVQGDKAVVFDLHNTDYYCHVFTYPEFKYVSSFGVNEFGVLITNNELLILSAISSSESSGILISISLIIPES